MNESRATLRAILVSAVDQFLDEIEEEYADSDATLGAVIVAAQIYVSDSEGERSTSATMWSSNEDRIWQRGMFETLVDAVSIDS